MSARGESMSLPLAILFVLAVLFPTSISPGVAADCEEDLTSVQEELNTTKERLAEVEQERDDYAERLENSTMVLIIVMFLLVGSYFVFYLNLKRQQVAFHELEKRTGVSPASPEPKPRKRRRG